MKPLSKESEARIISAVERVADMVNDGVDPTDAVVKTAAEMHLPHGHIQLVVQAYNTGRTNAHRKTADDLWSKAAEFPLADAAIAISRLYDNDKTGTADRLRKTAVAADYSRRPNFDNIEKKAVSVNLKLVDPPAPYPDADTKAAVRSQAEVQKRDRKMQEARLKAASAFDRVMSTTNDLRDYFRMAGSLPFNEVREACEKLHGEKAAALFRHIANMTPELTKQAARKYPGPATGKAYQLVKRALAAGTEFVSAKSQFDKLSAEEAAEEDKPAPSAGPRSVMDGVGGYKDASFGDRLKTITRAVAPYADTISKVNEIAANPGKTFNPLINAATTSYATKIENDRYLPNQKSKAEPVEYSTEKVKPETLAWELGSPDHEADLRQIRVKAMLNDWMLNDDEISRADPEQVASAYNELAQIGPRAMSQPLLAKMLVRQHVAGRMDAHLVGSQLLDLENQLKRRDEYPAHVDPFAAPEMPDASRFG